MESLELHRILVDLTDTFKRIREECRAAEPDGGGKCGIVSEEIEKLLLAQGLPVSVNAGWLVTQDERIVDDHMWIEFKDGTLLDPTADQFGDSFLGDVLILAPGDSRQRHYIVYLETDDDMIEEVRKRSLIIDKQKQMGLR
jgi:hypothetical protein